MSASDVAEFAAVATFYHLYCCLIVFVDDQVNRPLKNCFPQLKYENGFTENCNATAMTSASAALRLTLVCRLEDPMSGKLV